MLGFHKVCRAFKSSALLFRANFVNIAKPAQTLPAEATLEDLLKKVQFPDNHIYALKDPALDRILTNSVTYSNSLDEAPGDSLDLHLVQVSYGLRPLVKKEPAIDKSLKGKKRQQRIAELGLQCESMFKDERVKEAELACRKILAFIETEKDFSDQNIVMSLTILTKLLIETERYNELAQLIAFAFYLIKVKNLKNISALNLIISEYGQVLSSEFRFDEAEELLKLAKVIEFIDDEAKFTRAVVGLSALKLQLDLLEWEKAIEEGEETKTLFNELEYTDELMIRTYLFLGKAYEEVGKTETALQHYNLSLELTQDIPELGESSSMALKSIGKVFIERGNIEEGLKHYKKAYDLVLQLEDAEILSELSLEYADLLMKSNMEAEAAEVATLSISKGGLRPEFLMIQANCFCQQKNYTKAIELSTQALDLAGEDYNDSPILSEIVTLLASAYEGINDLAAAREVITKYLPVFEQYATNLLSDTYLQLASLSLNSNPEESEIYAQKGVDSAKEYSGDDSIEFARALEALATAMIAQNKYEGVSDLLERAIEIKKSLEKEEADSLIETYLLYGTVTMSLKNYPKAQEITDKCLRLAEEHEVELSEELREALKSMKEALDKVTESKPEGMAFSGVLIQESTTSPDKEGTTSPVEEGTSSSHKEGTSSPDEEGSSSSDEEGTSSSDEESSSSEDSSEPILLPEAKEKETNLAEESKPEDAQTETKTEEVKP